MSARTGERSTGLARPGSERKAAARGTARGDRAASVSGLVALDYPLLAVIATLLALGLFMVYSASAPVHGARFFLWQLRWVALGVVVFLVTAIVPTRWWQRGALVLMGLTVAGLVAVLVVGAENLGARRSLFGGRFQPSELAKLAVAVYVSAWVSARARKIERFEEGLVPFLVIMGLVGGLIGLERSFSVTMIVLTIGLAIFFVGGGNLRQVGLIVAVTLPLLLFFMWQAEYPWLRIEQWLTVLFDPAKAPPDQLQLFQLLREGKGIGTGSAFWESKASIPLLWSDYLFANIGADLHFPGTFTVVALYAYFGYRGLGIALNARTRFAALVAVGITVWVLLQAAIHIGTSLALIPETGQPLPFMSYGGSSLLSCMVAAGLLLSISRESREKKAVYAHFAFGGRDRRPRLPRAGRGRSAERADDDRGGATARSRGGGTRRRSPARSRLLRK